MILIYPTLEIMGCVDACEIMSREKNEPQPMVKTMGSNNILSQPDRFSGLNTSNHATFIK